MKAKTLLPISVTALAIVALSSCGSMDPEYQAWKKKKAQEAAASNNPYGAPAAGGNPYGVPQDPNTTRAAAGAAAPYQPLPGIPNGAPAGNVPADTYPEAPGGIPAAGGTSHTVVAGDSLWGLARKYGTTIEAIQTANGLTNTNIRTGQTLTIPGP